MKTFGLLLISVLMTGCFVTIPQRWSTEKEAYPGGNASGNLSPGLKASRESVMNFSYAEIFASAEKAISYAQINLTESNEETGIIYGTRSVLVKGFTKKYYYMILVKELGPEKCNVSVYSKQQHAGNYAKWGPMVIYPSLVMAGFAAAVMGFDYPSSTISAMLVLPVIMTPLTYIMNRAALKEAELKWSPDDDEFLDRIITFIRTDLLQQ